MVSGATIYTILYMRSSPSAVDNCAVTTGTYATLGMSSVNVVDERLDDELCSVIAGSANTGVDKSVFLIITKEMGGTHATVNNITIRPFDGYK